MGKISDKIKAIFVKGYILFVFLWMLFVFFVGFRFESGLNSEWKQFYLVVIGIYGLLVIVMVYLMNKIDIAPSKAKPIIESISVKEYNEFKEVLFKQAIIQGYNEAYSVPMDKGIDNTFAFKKTNGATYILQTIWMQEFDVELLDMATEAFWKETKSYVGKKEIQKQAIGLMQCVCVQRMNGAFRKYIIQNVYQEYKRYQILTAISFGGRRAYICQTKGGFFRSYYRYLSKEFEKITENIFVVPKR